MSQWLLLFLLLFYLSIYLFKLMLFFIKTRNKLKTDKQVYIYTQKYLVIKQYGAQGNIIYQQHTIDQQKKEQTTGTITHFYCNFRKNQGINLKLTKKLTYITENSKG